MDFKFRMANLFGDIVALFSRNLLALLLLVVSVANLTAFLFIDRLTSLFINSLISGLVLGSALKIKNSL